MRQKRGAEITATVSKCRNCCNPRVDELCFAILLEIEEEETLAVAVVQLSQPDRPAEVKSIVVFALCVPDVLARSPRITCGNPVCKRRAGVQRFVHEVIEYSSVELVGTRLHRVIEVAAARLTKLGGIIAGLNSNFLDGINTGLNVLIGLVRHAIDGVLTFNADSMRAGRHSINPELVFASEARARQQI